MNKAIAVPNRPPAIPMQEYTASCHCQKLRIRFSMKIDQIWLCNCTICDMRGGHWVYFPEEYLEILSGRAHLQAYLYNTRTCKNMFCNHCGTHVYAHARSLPGQCAIKLQCVDGFSDELIQKHLCNMDGLNWANGQAEVREKEGYKEEGNK
ncbi:MAG: GFA family protein [Paracoccaceae bacterium]